MSNKIAVSLCIVYLSVFSLSSFASDTEYKPGELIVRFAPKEDGKQRTLAEKNEVLALLKGGTVKHSYKLVPGLTLVKLPENASVEKSLPAFRSAGKVLYAEPNYKIRLLSTLPNDPRFNELWSLHNTGQTGGTPDADIDAPEAWDITTDSDIIVAVLDTGIDYSHPDLAANTWNNSGEIPGNGIDDDGNGYVDDIRGWDFADGDNDPKDYYFHGTHCAGTIGAVGNNSEGVTGVCWNVKIMNLKIFPNYGEEWFISGAIAAIEYGVDNGASVLSNSWGGGPYSQSLKDEIEAADANGVLFVVAAGNNYGNNNDTYPFYPASYNCENIIAVLSTDQYDAMSYFSNYGPSSVDLGAPGSDILSTFPTYMTDAMSYYGFSTDYETISGTSMATPHVAGACALVWSMNSYLSHLQVKDIILNSVDQIPALDGLCVSDGRLNLYNAVLEASKNEQILHKVDDIEDCVSPDNPNKDEITYTIYYANPPVGPNYIGTLTDVNIIDYLPDEVEPINPFDPNYDSVSRTYRWNIGTLSPDANGTFTLTVQVNELAEPMGTITNRCILRSNEYHPVFATEITDVNFWKPPVIYVDANATGPNNGMSWKNAFRDLQDALERASAGCGSEIWVAAGTYRPSKRTDPNSYSATFQLVDGVPIYGGFAGNEIVREQRNYVTNQTILNGDLNNDGYNDGTSDARHVVTASNVGAATIIDGFIVTKGDWSGIYSTNGGSPTITHNTLKANNYDGVYCNGASPTIMHNTIQQNDWYGIGCDDNSSPDIKACLIQNNASGIGCGSSVVLTVTDCIIADNDNHGIYGDVYGVYGGLNSQLTVSNSIIRFNGYHGIYLDCMLSTTIRNNWIHNNGCGIYITGQSVQPLVRNNTIVHNTGYGIYRDYFAPEPNISNCIIWENGAGQLYNCSATYSRTTDPNFMNPDDPNDLHIDVNSPCKNAGNPNSNYDGETDIDGEGRVKYGQVDIGGDEYYLSPADFDDDLTVNFFDYALFANVWQSNDPGFSLDGDNDVDYNDLALFCEDWLWQAGWAKSFTCGAGQSMIQTMATGFAPAAVSYPSVLAEQPIEKVEPIKIEQMIKWLEELWLDPEVRKLIDKDTWLKFIESVKEEL